MPTLTIQQILEYTVDKNASDIHLAVGHRPYNRIDGELVAINENILTNEIMMQYAGTLMDEYARNVFFKNREADFAYEIQYKGAKYRFRVNGFFEKNQIALALRLIPDLIRTVEELKLPPILNSFTTLKQGFILVVGPTGHGKSTTLAALINQINTTSSKHIVTVEDPIEFVYPKANSIIMQRELGRDTLSYENALISALREDPNVMMLQELRDAATIKASLNVAETGHLVFATLHTNSAFESIQRIIYSFSENEQQQVRSILANVISAIVSQRLVSSQNGGRRVATEILIVTPAVANMIREGKEHQIPNVIKTSSEIGMMSIEKSLVNLVREGAITLDTAMKYAQDNDEILRQLRTN